MLMFYRVGNEDGEGTVLSGHHFRLEAVLSRDPRAGSRCSSFCYSRWRGLVRRLQAPLRKSYCFVISSRNPCCLVQELVSWGGRDLPGLLMSWEAVFKLCIWQVQSYINIGWNQNLALGSSRTGSSFFCRLLRRGHVCLISVGYRNQLEKRYTLLAFFQGDFIQAGTVRERLLFHLCEHSLLYQWTSFSTEKIINIFLTHCVNKKANGMQSCSVIKYTSLLFLLIKKDLNANIFLIRSSFGGILWCMDLRVNCALGSSLCSSWLGTKNKAKGLWGPKLGLVTISRQPRWPGR